MATTIAIQPRPEGKTLAALRKEGYIPAVFYGPQEEATPIIVKESDFLRAFHEAGYSTIINLEGVGDTKEALIYDVQFHPVTDRVLHVDFYVIERGKKLSVEVPIVFVGEAPAEKKGFVVVKQLHEIEIEVRPSEIPHELTVDLSKLEDEDSVITVADLELPPSAEPLLDPEEIVASVTTVSQEEEPEEERSIEDVEIEQKGKQEGEEEAA